MEINIEDLPFNADQAEYSKFLIRYDFSWHRRDGRIVFAELSEMRYPEAQLLWSIFKDCDPIGLHYRALGETIDEFLAKSEEYSEEQISLLNSLRHVVFGTKPEDYDNSDKNYDTSNTIIASMVIFNGIKYTAFRPEVLRKLANLGHTGSMVLYADAHMSDIDKKNRLYLLANKYGYKIGVYRYLKHIKEYSREWFLAVLKHTERGLTTIDFFTLFNTISNPNDEIKYLIGRCLNFSGPHTFYSERHSGLAKTYRDIHIKVDEQARVEIVTWILSMKKTNKVSKDVRILISQMLWSVRF